MTESRTEYFKKLVSFFTFLSKNEGTNIPESILPYRLVFDKENLEKDDLRLYNDIYFVDEDTDFQLPAGLTVHGHVDLDGTDTTSLPDNLTVEQTLNISNTLITTLPKNLNVGSLVADHTGIDDLPRDLNVRSVISLRHTKIKSWPEHLARPLNYGTISLSHSSIRDLSALERTHSNLSLIETEIESLPDNLLIGGDLDLDYCEKLKRLPNNLYVVEDLSLEFSGIEEIPEKLHVGTLYYGHTNLSKYSEDEMKQLIESKGGKVGRLKR